MKEIKLFQEKPIKVQLVEYLLAGIGVLSLLFGNTVWSQTGILVSIALTLVDYKVSDMMIKTFVNTKEISLLGLPIMPFKKDVELPDSIFVFGTSVSSNTEWSTVSATGTRDRLERVVLPFFTANKHFAVFSSNKHYLTLETGKALSDLLDVELHNTLET